MSKILCVSDQQRINMQVPKALLAEIDSALGKAGCSDRSSFFRKAAAMLLEEVGQPVPQAFTLAPSRAGKGGRPTHKKRKPTEALREADEISTDEIRRRATLARQLDAAEALRETATDSVDETRAG